MISHNYKTIFIHIPKCAGTTIEDHLKKTAKALGPRKSPQVKHSDLEWSLRGKGLAKTINKYSDYFVFTFVRNPYDRFVSLWNHSNRGNTEQFERPTKDKNLSLNEYAMLIAENDTKQLSRFDIYHSKKQTDFILDFNQENFFSVKLKRLSGCDFIGRFETLALDYQIICEFLGIPYKLEHKNKSHRKEHYSHFYDDQTFEIVTKLYEKDIDLLGYKFEHNIQKSDANLDISENDYKKLLINVQQEMREWANKKILLTEQEKLFKKKLEQARVIYHSAHLSK